MASILQLAAPVQAVLATLMTYLFTLLGASLVFCVRRQRSSLLDAALALGAGIMLASSFWSLLEPGIALAEQLRQCGWLVAGSGFLCGSAFLLIGNCAFERLSRLPCDCRARRVRLMFVSITLHNIPEGLAVGVAFGALGLHASAASVQSAWLLALGIALQNFPEGAAVSLPLLREGYSRRRAFRFGHLSGIVEPVAGVLGALLAGAVQQLLPFLLAFAGGAMIFVVVSELVPECHQTERPTLMTLTLLSGFVLMMILDVALG